MRKTILIVDDNRLNIRTLSDILVGEYDIISASNGKEGLELLREKRKDIVLVILDIIMPVMDGIEFLKEYVKDDNIKNLPVIVVTNSDADMEKECLSYGVWDFISRSVQPDVLRFRVFNAIKRSRQYVQDFDELTGIYRRKRFYSATRELMDNNPNRKFAFIKLDIDRFKMINSFYGTDEGDRLLRFVARKIHSILGKRDDCTYGRVHDDIFAFCVPIDIDIESFIMNDLINSIDTYKASYYIKVSIGIYMISDNTCNVTTMYDLASLAVNECKGQYSKSYAYYNDSMRTSIVKEQKIINQMHSALENDEFKVFLQPKYDVNTKKPYGAEALVRWIKPDGTIIYPNDFIPVFESNGFIIQVDYYVWEQVCRHIRESLDAGIDVAPISVNISRVNLYNPDFLESLVLLVEKYRISPKLLNLEFTESVFVDEVKLISDTIKYLHKCGFKIMMDDFGSGYSSLNVLKDMDFDIVKIDMKFVSEGGNEKGKIILKSIVDMAKMLGMKTIAEGVETDEQVDMFTKLSADYIQGYYFAKPMPISVYNDYVDAANKDSGVVA